MSDAIKCDRCRKLEVKAHEFHVSKESSGRRMSLCTWVTSTMGGGLPLMHWKAVDLCRKCRESLAEWMVQGG